MQLSDVAQLIKLLDKSSLTEISFSDESTKVVLKKEFPPMATSMVSMPMMAPQQLPSPAYSAAAAPAPSAQNAAAQGSAGEKSSAHSKLKEITSPMVGTFYGSSSPGSAPLVSAGSTVKPGQVLCIIEAMKIMNEIECDISGVIEEVCVANETPVEYGTVLYRVRPA